MGLVCALATGNKMQDIVMGQMRGGTDWKSDFESVSQRRRGSGDKKAAYIVILWIPWARCRTDSIGLWDHQEGVPGRGDYELFEDTCHAPGVEY